MCNTSAKVVASSQRTNTMDITEIVSGSEEDESQTPPSPIPHSLKKVATNTKSKGGKQSRKRDDQDEDCDSTSQPRPPPSKRVKTAPRSTSGTQHSGSGVNNKYIKDDLPPGCTTNNEIWDTVYGGDIKHTVTPGGPVFHIAKQSLNNWRGGFATAAVAVITTLFANDVNFEDSVQRIEFTKAMLMKNCFLFSQNKGTDFKQANLWAAVLMKKKAAMENMLQAQQSLEKIEESIAEHLSQESIEGAHAQFLAALNPSSPEAFYLLTIRRAVIYPLASHLQHSCNESAAQPAQLSQKPPTVLATQKNSFGLFLLYDEGSNPINDPKDRSGANPLPTPALETSDSQPSSSPNLFHPYPNENSCLIGDWYWNQGVQKSKKSSKKLMEIIGSVHF
ncbi:hypothetical protein BDN67DRAFT_1015800 [Paxillus ammoniavirescens]|nr:hypothetical protein BDN67DRAFT_1015800 [Paxillus ammoniavirescens]